MQLLDRNQAIIKLCKERNVLHLGCVGFTDLSKEQRIELLPKTLHAQIYKVAKKLTGLDYSKEVIEEIKDIEGFETIFHANAEKLEELDFEAVFETIIVGDLIEHLSNPGLMLEGLKRFCDSDTTLVLTTPNAFGIASIIRYLFNRFREGEEHVMSFNSLNIINLLERHNYEVVELDTCYQEHAKKMKLFPILKLLLSFFPKFGGTLFLKVNYLGASPLGIR